MAREGELSYVVFGDSGESGITRIVFDLELGVCVCVLVCVEEGFGY